MWKRHFVEVGQREIFINETMFDRVMPSNTLKINKKQLKKHE